MIKIAVLGITGILLALFLKETRPVFAVLISMASCMLIFFCAVEDIEKKPLLQKMVKEHVFDRYIILSGKKKIGSVWGIFDGRGTRLYGEEGVVC